MSRSLVKRSTTRRRLMEMAFNNALKQFPTEILSFAFHDSTLIRFKFPDPNFKISNIIRTVRISPKTNIAGLKRYPLLEKVVICSDGSDDNVLKEHVDPSLIDEPSTYPDTVKNLKVENIEYESIKIIPRNMESLSVTSDNNNRFHTGRISNVTSLKLNGVILVGKLNFGRIEDLRLTNIHFQTLQNVYTEPVISPNLKRLCIDNGYLINSIFSNYQLMSNLKYLHLETKELKELDLNKLEATVLETLIINDIEYVEINLDGFKMLKKLQITKCRETRQVNGFGSLAQLEHLVLKNSCFDSTHFDTIKSLHLKFVDISYTDITSFYSIISIFKLPNLTVLLCVSGRRNNVHDTNSNMLEMRKVLNKHKKLKLFTFNASWIQEKQSGKYYLELPIESEERTQIIDLLFNIPTIPRLEE